MSTGTVLSFEAVIAARDNANNDTGGWVLKGSAQRNASGSIIVNNVLKEVMQQASTDWDVRVNGNTTALDFDIMPDGANTTKWKVIVTYATI
jgi:hypothetical protein